MAFTVVVSAPGSAEAFQPVTQQRKQVRRLLTKMQGAQIVAAETDGSPHMRIIPRGFSRILPTKAAKLRPCNKKRLRFANKGLSAKSLAKIARSVYL